MKAAKGRGYMATRLFARFYRCKLVEEEERFYITGRSAHWTIGLGPGLWLMLAWYSLPHKGLFLCISAVLLIPTVIYALLLYFIITVDKHYITIKLRLWRLPVYAARARLSDLDVVSPHNLSATLKIDYDYPWDGDKKELYIEYKGKHLLIGTVDDKWVWDNFMAALRRFDQKHPTIFSLVE